MTCPVADNPKVQHARATDYRNWGCRCEAALDAYRAQRKKRHLSDTRRVDATGTRRRLQALKVIGWSTRAVADQVGIEATHLELVLYRGPKRVTVKLERAVRAGYDQLWDKPGGSAVAAGAAARQGWLGPLWWDDDTIDDPNYKPDTRERGGRYDVDPIAVELALSQQVPDRLTRGERLAVVDELTRRGLASREIAQRLNVAPRVVQRDRSDLRRAA